MLHECLTWFHGFELKEAGQVENRDSSGLWMKTILEMQKIWVMAFGSLSSIMAIEFIMHEQERQN